jgi:hypothetical protein
MELSGSEVDDVIAEAEAERNRADACIAAAASVVSARWCRLGRVSATPGIRRCARI